MQRTHVVPRAWFGDMQEFVIVKSSITTAVQDCRTEFFEQPPFVLTFTLSLGRFHRWIDCGLMKKTNELRGGSYQIFQDVNLAEVDPQYTVLDIAAASTRMWPSWREVAGIDPI